MIKNYGWEYCQVGNFLISQSIDWVDGKTFQRVFLVSPNPLVNPISCLKNLLDLKSRRSIEWREMGFVSLTELESGGKHVFRFHKMNNQEWRLISTFGDLLT